jgi:hypothetical protein
MTPGAPCRGVSTLNFLTRTVTHAKLSQNGRHKRWKRPAHHPRKNVALLKHAAHISRTCTTITPFTQQLCCTATSIDDPAAVVPSLAAVGERLSTQHSSASGDQTKLFTPRLASCRAELLTILPKLAMAASRCARVLSGCLPPRGRHPADDDDDAGHSSSDPSTSRPTSGDGTNPAPPSPRRTTSSTLSATRQKPCAMQPASGRFGRVSEWGGGAVGRWPLAVGWPAHHQIEAVLGPRLLLVLAAAAATGLFGVPERVA